MARRGFSGMNALRAALGAATGVAEGLQQRDILAAQRKKEEEANSLARFNALQAAGFGFVPVRSTPDAAAKSVTELQAPDLPTAMGPSVMGQALSKATQGGLGVSPRPTGMLDTPISLALDTTKRQQFERAKDMQPANAADQISLAGMKIGLVSPEEVAKRKAQSQIDTYRQQRLIDVETDDEKERNKATRKAALDKDTASLIKKTYRNKDGKPFTDEEALYMAQQGKTPFELGLLEKPMTEAERKSLGVQWARLALDRDKFTQDKKDKTAGEGGKGEVMSGLQAMGVARANSALNLLETNTKIMDKFEQGVLNKETKITALQLEAARFALSGKAGAAVAEKQLAEGIPMVMPPNPALLRYVRAAKGISGAVREITPRGGSNLMMQMEQTLAGIGPAGADAESINQVQTFRNDILTGVREGVRAMGGAVTPQKNPANPYR